MKISIEIKKKTYFSNLKKYVMYLINEKVNFQIIDFVQDLSEINCP